MLLCHVLSNCQTVPVVDKLLAVVIAVHLSVHLSLLYRLVSETESRSRIFYGCGRVYLVLSISTDVFLFK